MWNGNGSSRFWLSHKFFVAWRCFDRQHHYQHQIYVNCGFKILSFLILSSRPDYTHWTAWNWLTSHGSAVALANVIKGRDASVCNIAYPQLWHFVNEQKPLIDRSKLLQNWLIVISRNCNKKNYCNQLGVGVSDVIPAWRFIPWSAQKHAWRLKDAFLVIWRAIRHSMYSTYFLGVESRKVATSRPTEKSQSNEKINSVLMV